VSEIDYGARARLDYIETQLQALFPDSYVPFAEAGTPGMPTAVVALARAGNMIAAIKDTAAPPAPGWPRPSRPSKRCGERRPNVARLQQVAVGGRVRVELLDLHVSGSHPLQQPVEVGS
jgi:hypothetical protein